jgi:hypothetical protein
VRKHISQTMHQSNHRNDTTSMQTMTFRSNKYHHPHPTYEASPLDVGRGHAQLGEVLVQLDSSLLEEGLRQVALIESSVRKQIINSCQHNDRGQISCSLERE